MIHVPLPAHSSSVAVYAFVLPFMIFILNDLPGPLAVQLLYIYRYTYVSAAVARFKWCNEFIAAVFFGLAIRTKHSISSNLLI